MRKLSAFLSIEKNSMGETGSFCEVSVKFCGKPLPVVNNGEKNWLAWPGVCSRVQQTWKRAGKEKQLHRYSK